MLVNKKMIQKNDTIAKKYFEAGRLCRKKAGLERVRNAKNIHSSLLPES
jgi:hypothetical protein